MDSGDAAATRDGYQKAVEVAEGLAARQPGAAPPRDLQAAWDALFRTHKLAEDWRLGLHVLTEHRQFLRRELRSLRRKSPVGWAVRAVRSFLDQPGGILLLLALLALNLAIWKNYFQTDWLRHPPPAPNTSPPPSHGH